MTYPVNHIVRISTGTVDIVPAGPPGMDLPVIARLPVRMGESNLVKRRAYLMAAAPGMAAALEKLLNHVSCMPTVSKCPCYLEAKAALTASRTPEERP